MCEPRHGSIYASCRDLIREEVGRVGISNREMLTVIAQHKGCMNGQVAQNSPLTNSVRRDLITA